MPRAADSTEKHQPLSGVHVGLPRMPKMYGLKARKQYLPWGHAEERLAKALNYWVCTVRPDGRPHAVPVSGMWFDGAFYFGTARNSCKAANLARNCNVSVHLESGSDVIILEGKAEEVDPKAISRELDAVSRKKYKMPLTIMPGSVLYRVRPRVALAWLEKDMRGTATRWEFES